MTDNALTRVPVYTSEPDDPVGSGDAPPWYARAGNRLLSFLDNFGYSAYEPDDPRVVRSKAARNRLLGISDEERPQFWPEKMLRSAVTLAGDVRTGNVPPPGLRREDYTDIPADPSKVGGTPHDDLIQRVQDMAGLAMTGGLAGTGGGGRVLGSGPVPVERNFKDVAYPHAKMERGDWARYNRAVENGDHTEVELPLRALNATQKTVNPDFMSVKNDELPAVLKKGGEYYIQDGHHRLMREAASGKQTARVRLYDVDPSTRDPRQLTLLSSNESAAPLAALEHLTTGQLDDAARAVANKPYKELDHAQQQRAQKLALETVHAKNDAAAPVSALERAPVWYSPVEHALEQSTQGSATGAQWLATIRNSRGVKPEELDWTGLRQFLEERADKPVTRPELHEYLRDNRVELQDVTKGGHKDWTQEDSARLDDLERRRNDLTDAEEAEFQRLVDRENNASEPGSSPEITKYQSYQLPGGENYREHLITMPRRGAEEARARLEAPDRDLRTHEFEDLTEKAYGGYRSSHWGEPNIVAHVRSNVREMQEPGGFVLRNRNSGNTTRAFKTEQEAADHLLTLPEKLHSSLDIVPSDKPIKKRSLHLEEVQSDWHQAGRRKGYKDPEIQKRVEELRAERAKVHKKLVEAAKTDHPDFDKYHLQKKAISEELDRLENSQHEGVPDAPWKKTWHELALRRMIRLAAEEGMDRISWTPGEAQAARYDLSKQLKELQYLKHDDGTYEIAGVTKDGGGFNHPERVKADKLSDIVGKEMAEKIVRNEGRRNRGQPANGGYFEGVDLKVGGEGMRGFYDKMMVQAAEKLGREYGVKVVKEKLPGQGNPPDDFMRGGLRPRTRGEREEAWRREGGPEVWYFDIPPAMREAALSRGMPLFSGGKMFVPAGTQERSER